MADRKTGGYNKWVVFLQLVAVLLLSALLVGILAMEISRTADALQYEEVAPVSVPLYMDKVGYVFYDTAVVESIDRGPIDYRMADGASVKVGDVLAVVYADGTGAGTRERAREIASEIERLQALDGGTPPDYHTAYAALMKTLSGGGTVGVADNVATLTEALSLFAAQREEASAREAQIAELRAAFDALIENDRDASNTVTALGTGVFYRSTDGFEETMTTAATETLTVGALAALLEAPQDRSAAIGRIATGNTWRLAVAVSEAEAALYTVGATYPARFPDTGEVRSLLLTRIGAPDVDGNCLLILTGEGMPPANFERRQRLSLCYSVREGLSVPMAALTEQDGVLGVYIVEEGLAAWRTVTPLYAENGYCLVSAAPAQGALARGDRVLVTLRRVYEGKLL